MILTTAELGRIVGLIEDGHSKNYSAFTLNEVRLLRLEWPGCQPNRTSLGHSSLSCVTTNPARLTTIPTKKNQAFLKE